MGRAAGAVRSSPAGSGRALLLRECEGAARAAVQACLRLSTCAPRTRLHGYRCASVKRFLLARARAHTHLMTYEALNCTPRLTVHLPFSVMPKCRCEVMRSLPPLSLARLCRPSVHGGTGVAYSRPLSTLPAALGKPSDSTARRRSPYRGTSGSCLVCTVRGKELRSCSL